MTPRRKNQLLRALRKVRYFDGRKWFAYCTPFEIVLLQQAGAIFAHGDWAITRAVEHVAEGRCNQQHYYFTGTKDFDEKLRDLVGMDLSCKGVSPQQLWMRATRVS